MNARIVLSMMCWLTLAAARRSLLFHGEYVTEVTCEVCHADAFCPGITGGEILCPTFSFSDPQQLPSSIDDCVCIDGKHRIGDNCTQGLQPYWYTGGLPQICPDNNMLTITDGATSALDCVCKAGFGLKNAVCQQCVPGQFKASPGNETCSPCPAGEFSNVTAATACLTCPANTFSLQGEAECSACRDFSQSPPGTTSGADCSCNAGFELGLGCEACSAGKYKPTVSSEDACTACADNKISPVASISVDACVCNAGFTGPDGAAACTACDAGTYKAAIGSAECVDCGPDTYSDTLASTECTVCIANSSAAAGSDSVADCACDISFVRQELDGEPVCVACDAGKYASANECVDCAPGSVSAAGAIECVSCGSGETSIAPFVECVCAEGFTGTPSSCAACEVAEYKDTVGTAACTACPNFAQFTQAIASTSVTDCLCEPGYFAPDASLLYSCEACAGGTYSISNGATKCLHCLATVDYSYTDPADAPWTDPSECTACSLCLQDEYDARPCSGSSPSLCVACPSNSGTFAAATASEPNTLVTSCMCDEDYYGPLGGPCASCGDKVRPNGRVNANTTVQMCECPAAYESVGDTECSACPIGKYKESISNDPCTTCPAGFTTLDIGAGGSSLCVCDVGSFLDSGSCKPCPVGTYKNDKGDHACTTCPSFTDTNDLGAQQCQCVAGYSVQDVEYTLIAVGGAYTLEGDVSNTPRPTLTVPRGVYAEASVKIYFHSGHPLRITDQNEHGSAEYAGSTHTDNMIALSVPVDFAGPLYYYCNLHPHMGVGVITVEDTWPCSPCLAGSSKATVNNSKCELCAENFYEDQVGSTSCAPCAANSGTHGSTGQELCRCDAGYQRTDPSDASETCLECGAGTFKPDHLQLQCGPCSACDAANERLREVCSSTQDTQCAPCQNNSHLPAGIVSDTFCYCHAGYEADIANDRCKACLPGFARASNFNNSIACEPCPPQFKSLEAASTTCVPCATHCADTLDSSFYVAAECTATTAIVCQPCTACEAGKFSRDATGTYNDTTCGLHNLNDRQDTICQPCVENFYCADAVMRACTPNSASAALSSSAADCLCDARYYRESDDSCALCPLDAYCIANDDEAHACPVRSVINYEGGSSVLECQCLHGYYRDQEEQFANGTGFFVCELCAENMVCFNNSQFECQDDRQVSPSGSQSFRNCTCIDGWYNDPNDWDTCLECPANSYCRGGYRYACPALRWTQNLTRQTEVEACKCIPGLFENANLCAPCQRGTYCPGDNNAVQCPAHATSALGSIKLLDCLCEIGYTNTSWPGLSCVQCPMGVKYKSVIGNTPCLDCTLCKADQDQYEAVACVPTANAVCDACNTCSDPPGFYVAQVCQDKVNAQCAPCSICDLSTQYEDTACRPDSNTVCENIDFDSECPDGRYRGGHTSTTDSLCLPCQYQDIKYLGYTLHTAIGDGTQYNNPYSCPIQCLGNSKLRNASSEYLGCISCETGNVLLKDFTVSTYDETCSFTCKQDYVRILTDTGEEDCVTPPLKASTDNAGVQHTVLVTNFERTALGNTFTVEHTNHSRFIVVVGKSPLQNCRMSSCCYADHWRVSTLAQAGFPSYTTVDGCSRATPNVAHELVSSTTLKFSVSDADIGTIAQCYEVASGVNSSTECELYATLLDTVLSTTVSTQIRLTLKRAEQFVFFSHKQQYIALDSFDAQVFRAYTLDAGESVYVLKIGLSGPVFDIVVRVQNMLQETTRPDGCDNLQFEQNAQYMSSNTLQSTATHTTHVSYWKGHSDQVIAYLTLRMGLGNEQDIAVSRNLAGVPAVCSAATTNATLALASIRTVAGMGSNRITALYQVQNENEATHGELGQLMTFAVQAFDTNPLTITLVNLLALYTRSAASKQAVDAVSPKTVLDDNFLHFTYNLRSTCRQYPQTCAYESWHPTLFYDNSVHVLRDCTAASKLEASTWLRNEFGVPHDDGHVATLCSHFLQNSQKSYQAVLVHTGKYLSRNVWLDYQNTNMSVTEVQMWVNFQYDH